MELKRVIFIGLLGSLFLFNACLSPTPLPTSSPEGAETRASPSVVPTDPGPDTVTPGAEPTNGAPENPADLIFHNGTVLTMDEDLSLADALAIRGQEIIRVGNAGDVLGLRGKRTRVIDLKGRTLMPGFVDAHTHIFNESGTMGLDLQGAQDLALRKGITTLGIAWTDEGFVSTMRDFNDSGKLEIRTSLYLIYNTACGDTVGTWFMGYPPTRERGEMLRIGGVKMYADGGSCGSPAFSEAAGLGKGDLWLQAEEMAPVIRQAQEIGHQVIIHAIGDRAVEQTLNAYQQALDSQENTYRHRIEHNSVVRPDQMPRYSEIGVLPVIFGTYFVGDSCPGESSMAPGALAWDWPYRELMEANPGLTFAWHGDDPYVGPVSPLLELFSMTTDFEVGRDGTTICETPERLRDRKLTPREALPLMTSGSAYALFREDEVGKLQRGLLADMIVLDDNPLAVDPQQIKDLEVQMTMVGGDILFCAADFCRDARGQKGHTFTAQGAVPEGAQRANVGVRINMECDSCQGPGRIDLYRFRYAAGENGNNLVPNPGFARGMQGWGIWGSGQDAVGLADSGTGKMLTFSVGPEQAAGLNSETFPVTAGERFQFSVQADVKPGSANAGYFSVFFLDGDGGEIERVNIPFHEAD